MGIKLGLTNGVTGIRYMEAWFDRTRVYDSVSIHVLAYNLVLIFEEPLVINSLKLLSIPVNHLAGASLQRSPDMTSISLESRA
ncbi:hypothetical protein KY289_023575 [Solanum tuberosum]|nr:hypothetical protein KY289_023575 [Solanum tuberosum]